MARQFIAFFFVLCLALNVPVAAFAQTAGKSPLKGADNILRIESAPISLEEAVRSSGTAAQINALDKNGNAKLKDGNYVRYIDRVDLPDYAVALYRTLEEGSDGDGTADVLIDVTKAQKERDMYVIRAAQFSGTYSSVEALKDIADSNYAEACAYIWAATGAFDRDHPEVFWLNEKWNATYVCEYASNKTYTQDIYLILKSPTNDIRYDSYTDPAALKNAIAERDAQVKAILDKMPSTAVTDAEKMRYFNEWLTHNNEFNTAAGSGNISAARETAWECISALKGSTGVNGPVCAGYSRAFQVLCMNSGIPCVLVSGVTYDINTGARNGHMWNYVRLENNWYGVDVTWNDPTGGKSGKVSGHERENYLFVGADTVAATGGRTFLAEHPVENNVYAGDVCFTNGPVLSDTAYSSAHTHTFGAPAFLWAANGKTATAVFTCAGDPTHTAELPAAVTSAVKANATCENMGTTTYTASVTFNGISYTGTKDVQDIPALGHNWGNWVQTKAPAETEKGEETRTCRRDSSHTETREIPELNHIHSLTLVPEKAPTATEAGNKAYYTCSGCDRWFEDAAGTVEIDDKNSTVIPKLPSAGLLGDIDGNGTVDAIDYMLLKRHVLGTYAFTDGQTAVADVNHSGTIDAIDYMLLKRYVLGTYVIA